MTEQEAPAVIVHTSVPHDSAEAHVTGRALYIDDLPEPRGTLHVVPGLTTIAHGRLLDLDLAPVRAMPGVVCVLTASDIPGKNDVSPALGDEPLFVEDAISFHGQVVFAVVAETRLAARHAARAARMRVEETQPVVTVSEATEVVLPDFAFGRGHVTQALDDAPLRSTMALETGGQEHFYLEGQAAFALPEEERLRVHSSTQHPTEVQHIISRVLGVPDHNVGVICRRMGGGFGGKESQASQWAALAALAAHVTRRPCKIRLDRDDDFVTTGKRHDMVSHVECGFDHEGNILGLAMRHDARCGYSADLSLGVIDRAMFHSDNAYFLPAAAISSRRLKTNTVSNTAFRGFGGPQGVLAIERVIDHIAQRIGRDPLDIRKANLYRPGRATTPYGMEVFDCDTLPPIIDTLEKTSQYRERRRAAAAFNATSPILKRGIALTPVKFGISFTLKHLNQAGALVHVYGDGSVLVSHGGTEMGQGLHTKINQIVADTLGLTLDRIRITATDTEKVPNTGPTAASSGTDLNGMAAKNAATSIRQRMAEAAAHIWNCNASEIHFAGNMVFGNGLEMSFSALAKHCILERISLSSTGFYRTPDITWDRATKAGRPFFYFAYGAACSEVLIDTMTGEMRIEAVDILHDCGHSLNPALDIGQIEGGFVQGMGWLTTEELVFDAKGRLRTHAPSTYKIPLASDVPARFSTKLWHAPNRERVIYKSKAIGEPPVMLATSVFSAISDAIYAVAPHHPVLLRAPATPEAILDAVNAQRTGP